VGAGSSSGTATSRGLIRDSHSTGARSSRPSRTTFGRRKCRVQSRQFQSTSTPATSSAASHRASARSACTTGSATASGCTSRRPLRVKYSPAVDSIGMASRLLLRTLPERGLPAPVAPGCPRRRRTTRPAPRRGTTSSPHLLILGCFLAPPPRTSPGARPCGTRRSAHRAAPSPSSPLARSPGCPPGTPSGACLGATAMRGRDLRS
jgi:hypothetical protein